MCIADLSFSSTVELSLVVKMLRTVATFVFVAVQVVFCQNLADFLSDNENEAFRNLPSLEAIVKCGEGSDEGVHRCVKYFQCNSTTNTISEGDEEFSQTGTETISIR